MTQTKIGGKVIASGGFGCIFKPALKCKNKDKRQEDSITKLMKKKHTKREYDSIMKFKKLLDGIPNYSNYFLIDGFSTCDPDTLNKEDLENFNKKCSALKKIDLTEKNVNSSLDKLTALNMPYGGVDVGNYIESVKLDFGKIVTLNNSLISLLVNGIIPMNKTGVLHCDIKEANILVKEEKNGELMTRLIDWGLSTTFNAEKKVPEPLTDRPFQYNVPFSNVLFNDKFPKMYSEFLKKNPNPSYFLLRSFVINYVVFWIDDRGPGHFKTLNGIFKDLFEKSLINLEDKFKDDLIEFDYTFYFIFEYITEILFKFTKNNKFDSMEYFSSVFVKNIDVWGFIMTYLPILEKLYDHFDDLSEPEIKIMDKIKNMILFCIESSTEPIEINKLVDQLKELNPLFLRAAKQSSVHFLPKSESQSSISKKRQSRTKISSSGVKISSNKTKKTSIKQKSSNKTKISSSGTKISSSGTKISSSGTKISSNGTKISSNGTKISSNGTRKRNTKSLSSLRDVMERNA